MTPIEILSECLDEDERNRRVYDGHILIFRNVGALHRLLGRVLSLARDRFGGDPARAHAELTAAEQDAVAQALRDDIIGDEIANDRLGDALAEVGVRESDTYRDSLNLRFQPPAAGQESALVAPLEAHRDTWGSNVMAQTNWWTPVLPVSPDRTLAVFPSAFCRIIANDSAEWDIEAFLAARKAGTPYPMLPTATDPPSWAQAVPLVIAPGDLLCFSGAHLHASVPNSTSKARLSLEWRTVNGPDARAGRGAPNVDGDAPWIAYNWFKRLDDGARLGARARTGPAT